MAPRVRRAWTEEEVELCKQKLEEGLTCREVGALIGRSKEAVSHRNRSVWKLPTDTQRSKYSVKGISNTKLDFGNSRKRVKCKNCEGTTYMENGLCCKCDPNYQNKLTLTKKCSSCSVEFETHSRGKKQCNDCIQRDRDTRVKLQRERNEEYRIGVCDEFLQACISKEEVPGLRNDRLANFFKFCYEVLDMDKCLICGYDKHPIMETHHIVPMSEKADNSFINLARLCPNCHTLVHRGIISQDELRASLPLPDNFIEAMRKLVREDAYVRTKVYMRAKAKCTAVV